MKAIPFRSEWSLAAPRIRIESVWVLLPVAVVLYHALVRPLQLLDFWWHLKAGEVIVTTGTIPRVDQFSFTAQGTIYILQNWLAEAIYYWLFGVGGLPAVITFNAFLLVLALLPILYLSHRAAGSIRIGVLGAYLAAISLILYSNTRPQVFSFVCFSIFYWILIEFENGRRNLLWVLPLLMAAWVNLHGAFPLGFVLILLLLVTHAARRLLTGASSTTLGWPQLGQLGLAFAASVGASFLNPEGYRLYGYVWDVLANPASRMFVTEWQPPRIDRLDGLLICFGPFLLTLLVLMYSAQRPNLTEMALFLVFASYAMTSSRNGIWFCLAASPVLARHLASFDRQKLLAPLAVRGVGRRLIQWWENQQRVSVDPRYGVNTLILVLLALVTIAVSPWVYPRLLGTSLEQALYDPATPVGAVDFLESGHHQGHIFHPQMYGDYLMWRLGPEQKTFFDGRVHLFDKSTVEDYLFAFHDSNWEKRLEKYDIRYLLLRKVEADKKMLQSARLSKRWQVVYEDDLSVLLERAEGSGTGGL